MADVYRKEGRSDRLVTTESERTAAVFEGFKLVKDEPKADKADNKTADNKLAANRNQN